MIGSERFHEGAGTYDIDNGIDGSHFVKVNLVERHSMNFPLGIGDQSEGLLGFLLYERTQLALFDDLENILQAAVGVPLVGPDLDIKPGYAFLPGSAYGHIVLFKGQAFDVGGKILFFKKVQQCPKQHVSADSGKAVQVQNALHRCSPSCRDRSPACLRVIDAAAYPAPIPLSILTTVTPKAQELSIVSRGPMPPRAAP